MDALHQGSGAQLAASHNRHSEYLSFSLLIPVHQLSDELVQHQSREVRLELHGTSHLSARKNRNVYNPRSWLWAISLC